MGIERKFYIFFGVRLFVTLRKFKLKICWFPSLQLASKKHRSRYRQKYLLPTWEALTDPWSHSICTQLIKGHKEQEILHFIECYVDSAIEVGRFVLCIRYMIPKKIDDNLYNIFPHYFSNSELTVGLLIVILCCLNWFLNSFLSAHCVYYKS